MTSPPQARALRLFSPLVSVFLLPVLFLVRPHLYMAESANSESDSRVRDLVALRKASADGVIRLSDANFNKFARSSGRPYDLVVFFDAAMLHDNPEIKLKELRREFGIAAKAFLSTYPEGSPVRNALFFCDIEFKQSEKVFVSFAINSLPHVRLVPHGSGSSSSSAPEMPMQEFARTAEGFADWIRNSVGISLGPIVRPPAVSTSQLIILGFVLLSASPFLIRLLLSSKTPIHDPRVWCVGGLLVYWASVSGVMFNIIRGMPFSHPDQGDRSRTVYFYKGTGAQLGAEGFAAGGLYSIVGLLLALTTHVAPRVGSLAVKRGLVIACVAGSYFAVKQLVVLESWKTS